MARKIIAVAGGTTSGKSSYISEWYGTRPDRRRIAKTPDDIKRAIAADRAVIIEVNTTEEDQGLGATIPKLTELAKQLGVPLKVVWL